MSAFLIMPERHYNITTIVTIAAGTKPQEGGWLNYRCPSSKHENPTKDEGPLMRYHAVATSHRKEEMMGKEWCRVMRGMFKISRYASQ